MDVHMRVGISVLVFFAFIYVVVGENIPGVVQLNTGTFDKVIEKFGAVFVKFDKKPTHGSEQRKLLKEIAQSAATQKEFIIGFVHVQDYGEKENQELADRYDLKKEDFPAYKLFVQGKDEPVAYTGDVKNADAIKRFIMKETGLWMGLPACIEEFDTFVTNFWKADQSRRSDILKQAREAAGKRTDEKEKERADIYVKYMEKIIEKGDDFIDSELLRVEKLADSKVSDKKKEQLKDRASILTSFQLKLKDEL